MFRHIYFYRLKAFMREKEEVFWSLLFPLILGLCFVVGFSGINEKAYTFHSIPVAIVYEQENETFKTTINNISEDDSQGEPFLTVTEASYDEAEELLTDKKIDGIIMVGEEISLLVNSSDVNQTALQSFINQYIQQAAMIETVALNNPKALEALIAGMNEGASFIREENFTEKRMDPMAIYYFSLIAYTALCGGFFGLTCARQLKANTSAVGMRKTISAAPRWLQITAEFLATYTIHLIVMLIVVMVMVFIYGIDLGNKVGYVALTGAVGSLTGISVGLFIGSLPRIKEAMQVTIFIVFSLGSSFLAGLMVADMKMIIEKSVPIINKINPATLISDALYSLTLYDTYERFFTNIISLVIIAVVFLIASIFMTRRESHASI